jgi:gamma-glutamyltranspeptidase/glutathione hydrolase
VRIEGTEIVCQHGAVATGPEDAARTGADVLERGGNAFDAAAAACLACAVLEPQAVDIGGYVLAAVVLDGASGRVWSLDANTVAPAASTPGMFRIERQRPGTATVNEREYACSVADDANFYGPLSTGVPGFLGGVGMLWERWGRLPWPEVVAPAHALVQRGLPWDLVRKDVDFKRAAINRFRDTAAFMVPAGDLWLRPDLARTLQRLAAEGWRDFYTGSLGREIADFVCAQGGILTREDMAAFSPLITEPLSTAYRGAALHTAIAPNGGFSVLSALADLESATLPPDSDTRYWTTMAATITRMWTERLADSPPTGATKHGTVHVSAADREGNLVSATISQGGLFGSCLTVPGTGIILGHGMCRFDPHPGRTNSVAPGKRPLNNVCPLLIRMPDRDIAIGTRGGRRIVSVALQLAQRVIDQNTTVHQAAVAPRIHTITGDPLEISRNFPPIMRDALQRAGYRTEVPDEVAGAAHGAELLHDSGAIRAGGNTWAAGV